MKKISISILVLSVSLMFGCASDGKSALANYHESAWYKPGASYEQTQMDFRQCEMYGKAHANMNPFMAIELTHDCMLNKGYLRK